MKDDRNISKKTPTPQNPKAPQDENPGGPPETKDLKNSAPGKSAKNEKPKEKAGK